MTEVTIQYHHENHQWWAESPDVEGFVATGDTLAEVRDLVREGVEFYLEDPDVQLIEIYPNGQPVTFYHQSHVVYGWPNAGLAIGVANLANSSGIAGKLQWAKTDGYRVFLGAGSTTGLKVLQS